jgi:hypothetical protein
MPRPNHVEMNGQVVEVDKPFELNGIRGGIYHPMYPRDSSLPVEEVANCHCLAQPVVDDDVLGMSLEERQNLQQEIIDADDGEWENELDAKNKAKAGIDVFEETRAFGGPNAGSQNYIDVEFEPSDKVYASRNVPITATRVVTAKNNLYISDNVSIKRRDIHVIDQGITETYERMGVESRDNLPRIVVLSDEEFGTNAAASYNAIENVMYIRSSAGGKRAMKAIQQSFAVPKEYTSTYTHEMYHWEDAEMYKAKVGDITNEEEHREYVAWIREKSKKKLAKLVKNGYDVSDISSYATAMLRGGSYEEVYTEYRVLELLGE